MVPGTVVEGAGSLLGHVAVAESQTIVLDGHKASVPSGCAHVAPRGPACGEERSVALCCPEPEHQRVVLNVGAGQYVLVEGDGGAAVEVESIAFRSVPREAVECQRGARCTVAADAAAALVHGVVGCQLAFVARQAALVRLRYLRLREGFDPYACFEHIAIETVSENQWCRLRGEVCQICLGVARRCVGQLLGAGEEAHTLLVEVDDSHHAAEVGQGLHRQRIVIVLSGVQVHAARRAVGRQAEGDAASGGCVAKEFLFGVDGGRLRFGHEVDGERFVGQQACHRTGGSARGGAVEMERR